MSDDPKLAAIDALATPPRRPQVSAPPELFPRFSGRLKRALGDSFGLTNFGVNIVELSPGAVSSMRHAHTSQDEFVYVIKGMPSLFNNDGETLLEPGMRVGFRAGSDDAHQLVNRTDDEVVYLEVGDRTVPDDVAYPDDDLAISVDGSGKVYFRHKDGTLYKNSNS